MFELLLIAIALAMDSVAVSIAIGSKYKNLSITNSLKIALIFGAFQGAMPLIGFLLGVNFAESVATFDHWIAFILLTILGGKMIYEANSDDIDDSVKDLTNRSLILLAIATSIDALAIGITFAFLNTDIYIASSLIAIVTLLLCTFAIYIGKALGSFLESKAEFLGGVILILIGTKILIEHLNG
jgi:putative Mn2+ efflux pump MntP